MSIGVGLGTVAEFGCSGQEKLGSISFSQRGL